MSAASAANGVATGPALSVGWSDAAAAAKQRPLGAFALTHTRKPKRAQDVMRVVAPPSQIRKQRVGDVDRARPFGPSGARERVEPLKLRDRRGELPHRAQATQRERLRDAAPDAAAD